VIDYRYLASMWTIAGVVISNLQFYINPLNYNRTKCNKNPLRVPKLPGVQGGRL
jgi:hypothetical protein